MDEKILIQKYRNDELNEEEWKYLHELVDKGDRAFIESLIEEDWSDFCKKENSEMDAELQQKIYGTLLQQIQKPRKKTIRLRVLYRYAAMFLFPVLLLLTGGYLYFSVNTFNEQISITTSDDENAGLVLPDGTSVKINSRSVLTYRNADFNRKQRMIEFKGEGFFKVRHIDGIPFLIRTSQAQIRVLGTTFNLNCRENARLLSLSLLEGKVEIIANRTQNHLSLSKNQKVIIDKESGRMQVSALSDDDTDYSWVKGVLTFDNTKLKHVFERLRENYGVRIHVSEKINQEDQFTGTLTARNLQEDCNILSQVYHFKIEHTQEGIRILP